MPVPFGSVIGLSFHGNHQVAGSNDLRKSFNLHYFKGSCPLLLCPQSHSGFHGNYSRICQNETESNFGPIPWLSVELRNERNQKVCVEGTMDEGSIHLFIHGGPGWQAGLLAEHSFCNVGSCSKTNPLPLSPLDPSEWCHGDSWEKCFKDLISECI